jgi:glucokinase
MTTWFRSHIAEIAVLLSAAAGVYVAGGVISSLQEKIESERKLREVRSINHLEDMPDLKNHL